MKDKIIDEDEFLELVDKYFSNNNNIYQFIEKTYSDLNRKMKKELESLSEEPPEIIHDKKKITKSITTIDGKRCIFPFKYKDMIYKNCINYAELDKDSHVCATDIKGKNKYGKCPVDETETQKNLAPEPEPNLTT